MTEPTPNVITKAHIKAIDKLYWDPAERATGVLNILERFREQLQAENLKQNLPENTDVPTDWDLFCFSIEWIGRIATTLNNQDLLKIARAGAHWTYSTHYSHAGKLYGAPDKRGKHARTRTGAGGHGGPNGNPYPSTPPADAGE